MVQTRAQTKGNANPAPEAPTSNKRTTSKRSGTEAAPGIGVNEEAEPGQHHQKTTNAGSTSANATRVDKVQILLDKYGQRPLADVIREEWPSSMVVMVHMMNALLSSTRISHNIAHRALKCLVDEEYHDLKVLESSSWQARTEVLTRGGYTHYRERTATFLGDLSELMHREYDNDASKMVPSEVNGDDARRTLVDKLKAVKGLGPVGCGIFLGTIQGFYPHVAPFLDKRNCQTAEDIGLGGDADELFDLVGKDPDKMARLHEALTTVRLGKQEHKLQ